MVSQLRSAGRGQPSLVPVEDDRDVVEVLARDAEVFVRVVEGFACLVVRFEYAFQLRTVLLAR
jgi:hypothetical protein